MIRCKCIEVIASAGDDRDRTIMSMAQMALERQAEVTCEFNGDILTVKLDHVNAFINETYRAKK